MNIHESLSAFRADQSHLAALGVHFLDSTRAYITDDMKRDERLAMDAQAALATTASSGIPWFLANWVDPDIVNIVFAPVKATEILPEKKNGDWTTATAMFPVVEGTGEVTGYDDFSTVGSTGLNLNFPQREQYLFQVGVRYGDLETERAGLARVNLVSTLQKAAADWLKRYSNYVYFYGVQGLQNYGILNDPSLPASITPSTKSAGGTVWMSSSGVPNATANEVFQDVQALVYQLATQTQGLLTAEDKMILALGPGPHVALNTTNSFGLTAAKIIKDNFPNLRIIVAPQYQTNSSTYVEGYSAAGNFAQLIAEEIGGEATGHTAFSDKLRAHRLIPDTSSYRQKWSGGVWGAIVKRPLAFASMLGI
jgi:hypothetical protein